jgi:3'-5' exoribonuclease
MFPEAQMLHYLDDLDSKMESMRAHFEREADLENPWTSYNNSLGRPLLNTRKFLAPKAAPPKATPEPEPAAEQSPTLPGLDFSDGNGNPPRAAEVRNKS